MTLSVVNDKKSLAEQPPPVTSSFGTTHRQAFSAIVQINSESVRTSGSECVALCQDKPMPMLNHPKLVGDFYPRSSGAHNDSNQALRPPLSTATSEADVNNVLRFCPSEGSQGQEG